MRELQVNIDINAPIERVWGILTDFARYGEWNPFLREIQGEAEEGARIRVAMDVPEGGRRKFGATITHLRSPDYPPPARLSWRGSMPVPGFFAGEHFFELHRADGNVTRLIHGEYFSGLFVPFVWERLLHMKVRRGFGEMNLALKYKAEHE